MYFLFILLRVYYPRKMFCRDNSFVRCATSNQDHLCFPMLLCWWQSAEHTVVALRGLRTRNVLVVSFVTDSTSVSGGTAGARVARFNYAGIERLEQGIIICTPYGVAS